MGTEVKQTKYIYEQVNKQLNKINVNKLYSTLIISNSQWRRQRFLSGRAKATSHCQEQSLVECVCVGGGRGVSTKSAILPATLDYCLI